MDADQWIDSWRIHQRIILYLLDAVEAEALPGVPQGMKGRSVDDVFAHIHNVRLMWLKASAPDLMEGLEKIESKTKDGEISKELLNANLTASAEAMEKLLVQGFETGKIKGFKPHPAAFYSYFTAHEWYHVGEICMTLTQAGHKLPEKILYGLWEWGSR